MNKWVRRSLSVGALSASALLVAGGAAQANDTSDNTGAGNGTQVALPVQAPINICGIAAAIGGSADADCAGGATAINEWAFASGGATSMDNVGAGNGTQVTAPIQAPVNLCGVGVGVLGSADASCDGGSSAGNGDEPGDGGYGDDYAYGPSEATTGSMTSTGNVGLLNGTQVTAPVQLPIDVCGVAVGLLGAAEADCAGGSVADLS